MATPRPICNMFHRCRQNVGMWRYLGRTPFPLVPTGMARPLFQFQHRSQGTRPCGYCSSTMGLPLGGTPSPVPIGQSVGSSSGELRVLSGPHPGTPSLVPVFLLGVLAFYTFSHTRGSELCRECTIRDRASALPLLVPQANPTPSQLPSTLQDLLLAPDACWTSPHWRRGFRSFMLTVYRRQYYKDV